MTESKDWPELPRDDPESDTLYVKIGPDDEFDLSEYGIVQIKPRNDTDQDEPMEEGIDVTARRRFRLLPLLAAGGIFIGLALSLVFGYFQFFGESDEENLPLVQALDDPVKVKPASPGGLEVPYQDQLVLNESDPKSAEAAVVERLLPPPEAPQTPPQRAEAEGTPSPAPAPAASEAAGTAGSGDAETAATETPAPAETATAAPAPAAAEPDTKAPQAAAAVVGALPKSESPAPAARATAAATSRAPAEGSYLLQLASLTSAKATEGAWAQMKQAHPALLGDMTLFVQQAKVGGRDFYRVQAGPFPNLATAQDLCAQLKAKKQDCLVVRR